MAGERLTWCSCQHIGHESVTGLAGLSRFLCGSFANRQTTIAEIVPVGLRTCFAGFDFSRRLGSRAALVSLSLLANLVFGILTAASSGG